MAKKGKETIAMERAVHKYLDSKPNIDTIPRSEIKRIASIGWKYLNEDQRVSVIDSFMEARVIKIFRKTVGDGYIDRSTGDMLLRATKENLEVWKKMIASDKEIIKGKEKKIKRKKEIIDQVNLGEHFDNEIERISVPGQ